MSIDKYSEHYNTQAATTEKRLKIFLFVLLSIVLLLNISPVLAQSNQESGDIESKIEIKIDGGVNESQKAKVQNLLDYFKNQNPRLKIKSENKEKDIEEDNEGLLGGIDESSVSIFLILVLAYILIFLVIVKKYGKQRANLVNNILMGALAVMAILSGLLMFFHYRFLDIDLKFWHGIVSIYLALAIIFHIITHWRVWRSYFKL